MWTCWVWSGLVGPDLNLLGFLGTDMDLLDLIWTCLFQPWTCWSLPGTSRCCLGNCWFWNRTCWSWLELWVLTWTCWTCLCLICWSSHWLAGHHSRLIGPDWGLVGSDSGLQWSSISRSLQWTCSHLNLSKYTLTHQRFSETVLSACREVLVFSYWLSHLLTKLSVSGVTLWFGPDSLVSLSSWRQSSV